MKLPSSLEAFLNPIPIEELLAPDDPEAEPDPLIPSLPKSSPFEVPELCLPPEKNDPNAAKG